MPHVLPGGISSRTGGPGRLGGVPSLRHSYRNHQHRPHQGFGSSLCKRSFLRVEQRQASARLNIHQYQLAHLAMPSSGSLASSQAPLSAKFDTVIAPEHRFTPFDAVEVLHSRNIQATWPVLALTGRKLHNPWAHQMSPACRSGWLGSGFDQHRPILRRRRMETDGHTSQKGGPALD